LKAYRSPAYRGDIRIWGAHSIAVGVFLLMITGYSHHAVVQADVGSVPSPAATSSTILQNEKLIQQIRQLEIANKEGTGA
jgi:hypothetical protein